MVSGFAERREEMVVCGLRRLGGMGLESSFDWEGSESISMEERPRCAVRALADERIEEGMKYGNGKG